MPRCFSAPSTVGTSPATRVSRDRGSWRRSRRFAVNGSTGTPRARNSSSTSRISGSMRPEPSSWMKAR